MKSLLRLGTVLAYHRWWSGADGRAILLWSALERCASDRPIITSAHCTLRLSVAVTGSASSQLHSERCPLVQQSMFWLTDSCGGHYSWGDRVFHTSPPLLVITVPQSGLLVLVLLVWKAILLRNIAGWLTRKFKKFRISSDFETQGSSE